MANPFITVNTDLPDIPNFPTKLTQHTKRCESHNAYIPSSHWLAGFVWYYIQQVNRTNFKYDIIAYDEDTLWYHEYYPSNHYRWHQDASIQTKYSNKETISSIKPIIHDTITPLSEYDRKLSFSLQLSDPSTYVGGDLQFLTEPALNQPPKLINAPKQQGTIIIFDPYIIHRVTPVKSGVRKSIVGWVVGPRWK